MKNFDLNSFNALVNKYLSPQGMGDLNKFIEEFPSRAGYSVLIVGGVMWFGAGLAVVYATTLAKDVSSIRAELLKSEALKPTVPQIVEQIVPQKEVLDFSSRLDGLYKNISVSTEKGSLKFSANSGRYFGAFREAINHAYNGGPRWRLAIDYLCVGRECTNGFLQGKFKVHTLSIKR